MNPKAFMEYSNDMQDVYKNIEDYNPGKKHKILIVFDMIADMINNKRLNPVVTELFSRGRKLSKKREIFRDIYKDRLNQIERASNDVDFRDLRYKVMSSGDEYQFDGIEGPIALLNNI